MGKRRWPNWMRLCDLLPPERTRDGIASAKAWPGFTGLVITSERGGGARPTGVELV